MQFSDVYCTTAAIARLAQTPRMQRECIEYIVEHDCADPPTFERVFALYCALQRGLRMRDFCARHALPALGIDPARFVIFGTVNGFVRRVSEYPVLLAGRGASAVVSTNIGETAPPIDAARVFGEATAAKIPAAFATRLCELLDGAHSLDEICCALGVSGAKLRVLLQQAAGVAIVPK